MEFENFGEFEVHDSGTESDIQLLFIPGVGGPEMWKHQVKYFSDDYRTVTFRTEDRDFESQSEAVGEILSRENMDEVVLVASDVGNHVSREHGKKKSVTSNVVTGFTGNLPTESELMYNLAVKTAAKKTKIARKMFFSSQTDYELVEEFCGDFDPMTAEEFQSYRGLEMEPLKNALHIRGDSDRFSSSDDASRLEPDVTFRKLGGGSFCFYEKPEEFNNAVIDFINRLTDYMESKEIRERKEKNKSLEEYEQSSLEAGVKRW